MNPDATGVPENSFGALNSCLLEGDPQEQLRARIVRRRAIFFSIVFQTVAVTALLIFPILGKSERLSTTICFPLPPFRLGSAEPHGESGSNNPAHRQKPCLFCKTYLTPGRGLAHPRGSADDTPPGLPPGIEGATAGDPRGVLGGEALRHPAPAPPGDDHPLAKNQQRVSITHIDPARILRRVEPIYPRLGFQLHRETRVELHAVISTDGSIQSLQAISGDPLFYKSAIDAVSQWHYAPTLLNDQPVEVDTQITVIYSLYR
jgi:hypothetical protein